MSVLIVDDDRHIVAVMTELLTELHLDVRAAHDGAQALQMLREGLRPSVVIMDLVMPITGGIELFAEMLADPALRAIPVITMSGHKVDMRLPSRAHLEKPFGIGALVQALRTATGQQIAYPPAAPAGRAH